MSTNLHNVCSERKIFSRISEKKEIRANILHVREIEELIKVTDDLDTRIPVDTNPNVKYNGLDNNSNNRDPIHLGNVIDVTK